MRKTRSFALYSILVLLLVSAGGCDCGGGGSSKCLSDADCAEGYVCDIPSGRCIPYTPQPGIAIQDLDPNEVNVLREETDDTDPTTEGFQINVTAVATDIAAGEQAELCKWVGGEKKLPCATASLAEAGGAISVTFTDFTLDYGLQTLRVSAAEAEDEVDVQALRVNECVVSITAPADHAALTATDDKDATRADLQYDVIADVTNVQAGNDCTLVAGDRPEVTAQPVGDVLTFSDADLPISRTADSLTLTVECTNNAGGTCSDSITFSVDLPECQVAIDPPTGTLNADDDEDDQTAGLQQTVTVTSDECPDGTTVTLTVNGVDEPTQDLASHSASFTITLPEDADHGGPSTVEANLDSPDDRTGHDVVQYSVDTVPPVVEITDPADGALLGGAADHNPATTDILEHDVSGTVAGGAEGSVIGLYLDGATDAHATYTMTADDALDDPYEFTFDVVAFDDGTHVLKVTADDPAANLGEDEISITTTMAAPGITISDPTGDPALLGCGDDLEAGTDELQYLVCADTLNVEDGANATLSIDNGQPLQLTVASNQACLLVTLTDGDHTLEACAQAQGFDEACGPIVDVTVDWTPPEITIESHLDGLPINTPTFDLVGSVTGAPDGIDVSLSVDGGVAVTVPLNMGGFVFSNVTLSGEASHDLEVSVDLNNGSDADGAGEKGCKATESISLILDTTAPDVALSLNTATGQVPADGATLVEGDDLDGDCENGFQADVLVQVNESAGGSPVPADTEVRLWVNSNPVVTALTDAAGLATFPAELLAQGINIITARVLDPAGNEGMDTANLTADCGCPVATVTPGPGARLSPADDVDAGTEGVQVDIVADTDAAAGVVVKLYLNEGMGAPCQLPEQTQVTDANGDATFAAISLCAGDNTIRITTDDAGKICTIANHSVNAKIGKPSIAFTNLADAQYLNLADADVSGVDGYQYDVTVSTIDAEDGSTAKLTVDGGTAIEAIVASDAATFPAVTLCADSLCPGAAPVLVATVTDLALQDSDPVQITVNVDRVAPVVTITRPDHPTLGNADDWAPLTDGFQTSVEVTVTGGNVGGDVALSWDAGSGPQNATKSLPANGRVEFDVVTWPDGFVDVSATHDDTAANTGDSGTTTFEVKTDEPEFEVFHRGVTKITSNTWHMDPGPIWNNDDDTSAADGFQTDFIIQTKGLADDTEVSICSDNAPGVSETCRDGNSKKIGMGTVAASAGGFGTVSINTVPMDQDVHLLFIEGEDRAGNYGATQVVAVTVDSIPPTLESIAIDSNVTDNDEAPNLILGAAEDTDSGTAGLQATFTVTTTGVEDDQVLTLYSNQPAAGTVLATAAVTGNTATFSATPAAPSSMKITAAVADAAGNDAETSPEVNVITDITAPNVSITAPPAGLLTQADGTNNGANLEVDIIVSFTDDTTLIGQQLKLSDGTTEQTLDITALTPSPHTFTSFPLPQGAGTNVTATVEDVADNEGTDTKTYDVDSIAPTVAFNTPATDITYDADDDQGDGIVDGDLTRTDWSVAVSDVDGTTTVELLYRTNGTTNAFALIAGATTTVDVNTDPLAFTPITLGKGVWDVIARTTDANSNVFETSPVVVTINIDVPTVCLEKVGGDATCGTGDELANDAAFLINEDEDANPSSFTASIVVVTDDTGTPDAILKVNGADILPVQPIASGSTTYSGVGLLLMPTTNTIRAEITNTQGNTGFVEITGVRAKETQAVATFTNPVAAGGDPDRQYLAVDDADSTPSNGLNFKPVDVIAADITNIADGVEVTLACLLDAMPATLDGTATATVTSGAVTFPDVRFPTAHSNYSCYIEGFDEAENQINTEQNVALFVDVAPPAAIDDLIACIGETTNQDQDNSDPADGDCDDVGDVDHNGDGVCDTPAPEDTEAAGCAAVCQDVDVDNSDPADGDCDDPGDVDINGNGICDTTCARRGGNITMYWTAPADDAGEPTTGPVATHEIRWMTTSDTENPCSDFDWDSATTDNIELGPAADPGQTMVAYLTKAPAHHKICVMAISVDAAGNESSQPTSAAGRSVPLLSRLAALGDGGEFGLRLNMAGDYDNDNRNDVVVGSPYFSSNKGKVLIRYADPAKADVWYEGTQTNNVYLGLGIGAANVNGDQFDDLVLSERGSPGSPGVTWVFLGSASGVSATPDITIEPAGGSGITRLGFDIAARPRSLDNSQNDSIIASSDDGPFVFFGNSSWTPSSPVALDTNDADIHVSTGKRAKVATSDFDGDSRNDIVVAVEGFSVPDGYGMSFFYYGPDGSWPATLDTTEADVEKTGLSSFYGRTITTGFVDSGATGDFIVRDVGQNRLYPYYGSAGQQNLLNGLTINNPGGDMSGFGRSFATTNDVSNDGLGDLVVGSSSGHLSIFTDLKSDQVDTAAIVIQRAGSFASGVDAGFDNSGDGLADIAVCDSSGNGRLFILY